MESKKKILLVEDEEDILKTIKMTLEMEGYEVVTACDGMEGLDKARNIQPDLIILDLMLPKLDGYKICQMLKFDQKFKFIPIIILTARAQEKDKKLGMEVGADEYLIKPFEPDVLLEKIKKLVIT